MTARYTIEVAPGDWFTDAKMFELLDHGVPCGAYTIQSVVGYISDACEITGGTFRGGRFYGGEFNGGLFLRGYFRDGTFNGGEFEGGKFSGGVFNGGVYNQLDEYVFYAPIFSATGEPIPVITFYNDAYNLTEVYPV